MDQKIILPAPIRIVSETEDKGVYEVDRLYPGYGHTLGNSIRRILLSSLPGAAVTKLKIEGVGHEFSTLDGVIEDLVTVLLNFKQLRFKLFGDEPEVATIDVKGPREVKGKDIKCPTQLEIVNKDQHLATLSDKNTHFAAEITVERGIGFVPAEELQKDKVAIGAMVLDAAFTPIRRANYEVENMRVGDRTDFNRLRLFIETDGTISPRVALSQGIKVMKEQLEVLENFEGSEESKESIVAEDSFFEQLKLSTRTTKALLNAGIANPQSLAEKTEEELLQLDGIGEKALSEIKKGLVKLNLSLRKGL